MFHLLSECGNNHTDCLSSGEGTQLTRLLEIERPGSTIRLVKDVASLPRYVALSYCSGVGGFLPPKLLTETSKFMREALQYIWVDSLCIMHDSDNDKSSELSKMKDIFEIAI